MESSAGAGQSSTTNYSADNPSLVTAASIQSASDAASWVAKSALALALAKMQYDSYNDAIKKQDDIAKRIQSRADELHNIWKESYLTCELNTIAEICAEPKAIAQTTLASIKAQAEISKQFSLAKQQAMYCIDSQCEGSRCDTDRKFATAQAKAAAWQANANINQEIARAKLENAQRLNNRLVALNAGRQHIANTNSALAQASQIYQQQSAAAAAGFNGAMATLGRLTQDTANANRAPMQNNMQRAQPVQASQVGQRTNAMPEYGYPTTNNESIYANSPDLPTGDINAIDKIWTPMQDITIEPTMTHEQRYGENPGAAYDFGALAKPTIADQLD